MLSVLQLRSKAFDWTFADCSPRLAGMAGMSAGSLRNELNARALQYARSRGLLHAVSDGVSPSVIFGRDEEGRHGNFHAVTFRRICADAQWALRLKKAHTASRRMHVRSDWRWMELDCASSSDALLMNVFCHPAALDDARLRGLLGVQREDRPRLGYKPGVPLKNGRFDQTEVDMKLGDLLVEAKLTEADFQLASVAKLARYRDLQAVFGEECVTSAWPAGGPAQRGYQVMRGILAAYATGGRFCLLCDARRTDLIEVWYAVLCRVQCAELRTRIMLVTWQELTLVLPSPLRELLALKYGITAP